MKLGIIVVGYNRKNVLERLLRRLNECQYCENVLLLVSLDYSDMPEIKEMAERFHWEHGRKEVISYTERMGLRKHILACGSYMEKYDLDAAAVFEDDIYPAEDFFSYMKQAVTFYQDDDRVAGISLYTHIWNIGKDLPFQPMQSPFDTYFLQYAQSWGQVWLKRQWKCFAEWYEKNQEEFKELDYLPQNVNCWPETSWLKYHIRYCVECDKYFVYPYSALSTCFAEAGEHTVRRRTRYQVPLQMGTGKKYFFPHLGQADAIYYDVFFENKKISDYLKESEICIDLYGNKTSTFGKRYWLTTKELEYEVKEAFGMILKPHELNCIYHISGNDIYLYDTWSRSNNGKKGRNLVEKWEYYYGKASPVKISVLKRAGDAKRKIIRKLHPR